MGADYKAGKDYLRTENIGDLDPAAAYIIPLGQVPVAVYSTDADVTGLRLRILVPAGGFATLFREDGVLWAPVVNVWVSTPQKIRSDGVQYQLYNNGGNAVNDVMLAYEA